MSIIVDLQIRAKNMYMWGPWSDNVALLRFPDDSPNCQPIPSKSK